MIGFKDFLLTNPGMEKDAQIAYRRMKTRKSQDYGNDTASVNYQEGEGKGESWEDGFKRRVVKTTKPEHKDKGYNWRIKGKDREEVTIKLYKTKPDYKEFVKQMKRVAGHEFGG
jgi:hypothetical protein